MYSLTLLTRTDLDEKERQALFDGVKKSFSKPLKEEIWGVRSLAYPIQHLDKAFYAYFEFDAEPQVIPVLDKQIKLNEDVIRYLLLRVDQSKLTGKDAPKEKEAVEAKTETEEPEKVEDVVVEEVTPEVEESANK